MKKMLIVFSCAVLLILSMGSRTNAQTTYTSTSSGNWSFMTWSPVGTPGVNDDVIIANGHTVTINQNISVRNLTVGGGTSGKLQLDGTPGREVRVGGNLTVASGGSFIVYPALTPTGNLTMGSNIITGVSSTTGVSAFWYVSGVGIKSGVTISSFDASTITMSDTATLTGTGLPLIITPPLVDSMYIGGNLINNGKFDMSVGSDTARCNVIFNNVSGDQTISGTGDTTRFRAVRLDKSSVANKVICSINVMMANPNLLFTAGTWEQISGRLHPTTGSLNIIGPGIPPLANTATVNITGTGGAKIAGNLNISGNFLLNTNDSLIIGTGTGKLDLTLTGGAVGIFTKGTVCVYGKMASNSLSNLTVNGANILIDPKGIATAVPPTDEYIFRTTTGSGAIPFTFTGGTIAIVNPNFSPTSTREEINLNSSVAPVISGTAQFILGQGVNTLGSPKGFRIRNNSKAFFNHLLIDTDTGAVNLLSALNVSGEVHLKSGRINLKGFNLVLGDTALLVESQNSLVVGDSGLVKTTRILNAPSLSTNIAGMGISIGSSANLDTTIISRGTVAQMGLGNKGIKRFFNIVPKNNSGLDAKVSFRYDSTEAIGFNEANLILFESVPGDTIWTSHGMPVTNLHTRTLTEGGFDSLNRVTAGDLHYPLGGFAPVTNIDLSLKAGWNLLSVPVVVGDPRRAVMFPTASSELYGFHNGYVVKESLALGSGYWLKMNSPTVVNVQGGQLQGYSVKVNAGWNMVGSLSNSISVSSITSEPSGLISSNFFEYNSGYSISDSIKPGKAYWVKVSNNGILQFSTIPSAPGKRIRIVSSNEMPPAPPSEKGEGSKVAVPKTFFLGQNYPNPFNPTTQISFGLPEQSKVSIRLFNVLGQEVAVVLDHQDFNAGTWSVGVNASTLPSGIYLYSIEAVASSAKQSFYDVKRMVFVK